MTENELSKKVIGCAIRVHRSLGPGLLESAYQACLLYELKNEGLNYRSEVAQPIIYEEVKLDHGYRIYILVEEKLVLELKTVDYILPVHEAQLLTYLKLGKYKLGLLLNFNESLMMDGIKRIVNGL